MAEDKVKSYPYEGSVHDIENKKYQDFEERVNVFVSKLLDGYIPNTENQNKVFMTLYGEQ